jgi:hypothetical protein
VLFQFLYVWRQPERAPRRVIGLIVFRVHRLKLLDQKKEFRPYRAAIKECLSWRTYSAFYLRLFATERKQQRYPNFMTFRVPTSIGPFSRVANARVKSVL